MTDVLTEPTAEFPNIEFPGLSDSDLGIPPADPPVPGAKTGDAQAPYGYTRAGTPRKPPGRKPTGNARPATASKPKTTPPPPKPKPASKPIPPRPVSTKTDYRPGIIELGEGIAAMIALAGVARKQPALIVDAATIDMGMPHLAEVGNAAAEKFPIVASILDKVLAVGPHATAVGGIVLMVAQIAVNHGFIPAGLVPGTQSPDALAAAYMMKLMEKAPAATQAAANAYPKEQPAS